MAPRDVLFVIPVLIATTMPAKANDDVAWGRMICEVVGSRIVSAEGTHSGFDSSHREDFPSGTELDFEYGLDSASALTVHLRDSGKRDILIDETFPVNDFRGVSQLTNIAEFKATYSEADFGHYRMNYKGSDQLYLKTTCGEKEWSGHFVQTDLGGLLTKVVSLECRTVVDARDKVLARLMAER